MSLNMIQLEREEVSRNLTVDINEVDPCQPQNIQPAGPNSLNPQIDEGEFKKVQTNEENQSRVRDNYASQKDTHILPRQITDINELAIDNSILPIEIIDQSLLIDMIIANNLSQGQNIKASQEDLDRREIQSPEIQNINELDPCKCQDLYIDGPVLSTTMDDQLKIIVQSIEVEEPSQLLEINKNQLIPPQDNVDPSEQDKDCVIEQQKNPQELFHSPEYLNSNSSQISDESIPGRATSIEQYIVNRGTKIKKKRNHFLDIEESEREIDLKFKAKSAEERKIIEDQVHLVLEQQKQVEWNQHGIIHETDINDDSDDYVCNDTKNQQQEEYQGAYEDFILPTIQINHFSHKDIADKLKKETQKLIDDQQLVEATEQIKGDALKIQSESESVSKPNESTTPILDNKEKQEFIQEQSYQSLIEQEQVLQAENNMVKYKATLQEANLLKQKGNISFQNKQHDQAIDFYVDALSICHPIRLRDCPGELIDSFMVLNVQLLNNLAFCYFNVSDYDQCVSIAEQVLQVDETNVKALYRISLAHEKKGGIEAAWKYINLAKNYDKKCQDIQKKYDQLKQLNSLLNQSNKKKEQQVYQRMFSNKVDKEKGEVILDLTSTQTTKVIEDIEINKLEDQCSPDSTVDNQIEINKQSLPIFASKALLSLAVSTIFATTTTRYLLKEKILTPVGIFNSGIIGFGLFGAMNVDKTWKSLAICALSSGIISILFLAKQKYK